MAGQLQAKAAKASPLILEKDEGEHRVWRPLEGGDTKLSGFILKVDSHNGRSSHLVLGTEDMPPGGHIEAHRHPGSPGFDEFMRAESVREGQKVTPVTKAEDAAILAKHAHAVIYRQQ